MQIVLPLIAILIIFRAWRGWRRSPLYSPKITLQVVGVCLLIVAVWVALSRGVLSGPLSHSPVALGILAAVAIIAIGTGATGLIIRITDRQSSNGNPPVPLNHSPVALGILAAVAIIVIETGTTGLIIRITDRHVAPVSPS